MEKIIRVNNLTRIYKSKLSMTKWKDHRALNGISFDVNRGEIFGILGPNGAGKTTTIKVLTTLLAPTSGSVQIFGYNCFGEEKYIRNRINFIFGGERGLYWRLSTEENMKYFGDLYRIPDEELKQRIPYLINLVGLAGREKEKVENYSKGMKQRLQIARSLINKPEVLFLDEPTIGLDPVGARELRSIILKLKSIGTTVILTTHYMYEADELCDRIALINKGEVIDVDTSRNLKIKYIGNEECSLEDVYIKLMGGEDDDKVKNNTSNI